MVASPSLVRSPAAPALGVVCDKAGSTDLRETASVAFNGEWTGIGTGSCTWCVQRWFARMHLWVVLVDLGNV